MNKIITAPRVFVSVLLLFIIAVLFVSMILPSYSYFKVVLDRMGVNTAKVELIFDRLNFDSDTRITVNGTTTTVSEQLAALGYDENATWGSDKNPYVISQRYHIQNLSVLQNNGFFKDRVKTDPATGEPVLDDNGNPIPEQSFFLVCTPDGLPVAIDCDGMTIAPIGTHDRPFTGNIKGALFAGEATYGGYSTTVSTIGNLTVGANIKEPDIGFFGYVGYYGTATTDSTNGNPIITGGYAADISDLTLADVTVESTVSIVQSIIDWFASIFGASNEKPHPHTADQEETHHIGIVAGHAEFATLSDISVFYSSDSIQTFSLAGGNNTSYYSITGLVGMLQNVNPIKQDGNLIGGAGNSISDSDMLVENGFGGGGAITGTLTGYMLAETIFNEHEMYLQSQEIATKDQYDVKEMHKRDGSALFNTVTMEERIDPRKDWEEVDYYTFQDTIFTFAMSSSSKEPSATDYVQKIWKNPEEASISATGSNSDWVYTTDPNPDNVRIAYEFNAITEANEHTAGGYYVLSYQDKNGTDDDWTDDTLYLMKINNTETVPSAACYVIPASDFVTDEGELGATPELFAGSTNISSFRLISTEKLFHEYAYTFKLGTGEDGNTYNRPFSSPFTDVSLGLTAHRSGIWTTYAHPTLIMSAKNETTEGGNDAYIYNWEIEKSEKVAGKFAVFIRYAFWGALNRYTKGNYTFDFADGTINYVDSNKSVSTGSTPPTPTLLEASEANDGEGDYIFSIYKVEINTIVDGNPVMGGNNRNLTAKNLFPKNDPIYTFDPSKYVLESDGNGGYTIAPIRSYNLNSGRGTYLTQLNHIVKLFKPTTGNFQIAWSENSLIGSWFGNTFNTNNGGVVGSEIGTSGQYTTIPTGMISFYISEASVSKPSYINIIVAVNPGQTTNGRIGLWEQAQDNGNQVSFSLTSPDQYFDLPISKVAANNTEDRNHILTVTNFKSPAMNGDEPLFDERGNPLYTDSNSLSYVYLGGEVALVYHSFEVTTPGVYFIGSGNGAMSVAYFSVSGAAGQGADGSSASPLGNIDFVYANNGQIVTVDHKFTGIHDLNNEDYTLYYPSYHFVVMIPKGEQSSTVTKIQTESIRIYRYIDPGDANSVKRHIKIIGGTNARAKGLSEMYEDNLDE